MRIIVIKQATDLQALGARFAGNASARESGLEQLQRLNPHVDFRRIEPGTVLLVPDAGVKKGESISVGGQAFEAFREQVQSSLGAAAVQVRQGHQVLADQRQAFSALTKTAAVKRLLDADPDLKPQLAAATAVFKKDQQDAKDAEALLKDLQEGALAELDALGKLLS